MGRNPSNGQRIIKLELKKFLRQHTHNCIGGISTDFSILGIDFHAVGMVRGIESLPKYNKAL